MKQSRSPKQTGPTGRVIEQLSQTVLANSHCGLLSPASAGYRRQSLETFLSPFFFAFISSFFNLTSGFVDCTHGQRDRTSRSPSAPRNTVERQSAKKQNKTQKTKSIQPCATVPPRRNIHAGGGGGSLETSCLPPIKSSAHLLLLVIKENTFIFLKRAAPVTGPRKYFDTELSKYSSPSLNATWA